MKHLIIALLFASVTAFSQSFEGGVLYKNTVKSKNKKLTDAQLNQMMGSEIEYFLKNGDYKYISNGSVAQCQLYINKNNKLYTKVVNSETTYWNDVTVVSEMVLKSEVKKNVITILNYQCDELTLTCKSGVQKYYYSTKIPVNPQFFVNHKYDNLYEVIKTTKSLTLKTIIETPEFIMETTATEIKPKPLDNKIFYLPANEKLVKSPY